MAVRAVRRSARAARKVHDMASDAIDGDIDESSGLAVQHIGVRGRTLQHGMRNGRPLDLGGDRKMSVALRKCEHAFNEDVLPPHAKVAEPLEFYAASKLDNPSRSLKDAIGKKSASSGTSMLLPHVAA